MYDSRLFRLNIKGIRSSFNEETQQLKISILPFVEYSQDKASYEICKNVERKAETTITLDFSKHFESETHGSLKDLVNDFKKIQWFKTKNVIIEHAWDKEAGYETISILSNSDDSIELKDMLYCGYELNTEGKLSYFCTLDTQYFINSQDCPFVRNSFIAVNENNLSVIREDTKPFVQDKAPKCMHENSEVKYYSSKKDAIQSIPVECRKEGDIVWVKLSKSKPKSYSWVGGVSDKDLVPVEI